MTGKEAEALGFLFQQHSAEITVAQPDLSLLRDRAGNTEGLQTFSNDSGGLCGGFHALFQRQSNAQRISPNGVFKCNRLYAAHDSVHINALRQAELPGSLQTVDAVLSETSADFSHSSFFAFEFYFVCHR